MSLLPKDSESVLVTTSARAIEIPITLYKIEEGKIAETTALVDSGATICCLDLHFARRMRWPLEKLDTLSMHEMVMEPRTREE